MPVHTSWQQIVRTNAHNHTISELEVLTGQTNRKVVIFCHDNNIAYLYKAHRRGSDRDDIIAFLTQHLDERAFTSVSCFASTRLIRGIAIAILSDLLELDASRRRRAYGYTYWPYNNPDPLEVAYARLKCADQITFLKNKFNEQRATKKSA